MDVFKTQCTRSIASICLPLHSILRYEFDLWHSICAPACHSVDNVDDNDDVDDYGCVGIEHEINAGILEADVTQLSYCMCFVRHIEGIRHHLQDPLAPQFVDVIEVNNMQTIERSRSIRLAQVKVGRNYAAEPRRSLLVEAFG